MSIPGGFVLPVAAVLPLSPWPRVVGSLLAGTLLLVAFFLFLRFRRADAALDSVASRGTRLMTIGLLVALGVVVLGGVWVDPGSTPRLFVLWWTGALILVMVLLVLALGDLMGVRRRAARERSRLWEKSRADMRTELERLRRRDDLDGN